MGWWIGLRRVGAFGVVESMVNRDGMGQVLVMGMWWVR